MQKFSQEFIVLLKSSYTDLNHSMTLPSPFVNTMEFPGQLSHSLSLPGFHISGYPEHWQ